MLFPVASKAAVDPQFIAPFYMCRMTPAAEQITPNLALKIRDIPAAAGERC
jgi:hypothetical protein